MISTEGTEMSPNQRFPFKPSAIKSTMGPDYHLVHTAIPSITLFEQSRGFPQQSSRFLASFAKLVSNCNSVQVSANTYTPDHYPPTPLKAGYSAHSIIMVPHNRFTPCP